MKEKLSTACYSEKVQILTLVPDSWSRTYAAEYFNVSVYRIRRARELKKEKRILAKPNAKQGSKILSSETLQLVANFFEDDEYSRLMPGKSDCVSISKNCYKQKRLLLCNLKELYFEFCEKHPFTKIGFSKFCTLRPKWCLTAGSSGTHAVCVCSQHQNSTFT